MLWGWAEVRCLQASLQFEIIPFLKGLAAILSEFCVICKSQAPMDNTVCFVNTCPLHIDLGIWWIAFPAY